MKCFLLAAGMWAAVLLSAVSAQLGVEAPPLKISKWVKGGPVDLTKGRGTNVYVVEFWATWCAPCRQSIPHLTELQQRFKSRGVVIIGVSDETPQEVQPFVDRLGSKMDYVVAVDDQRHTVAAYLEAFGVDGIPHAFVVDKQGRVAWQGHPLQGLDRALSDIVDDNHDIHAENLAMTAAKQMPEYFMQAISGTNAAVTRELGERILRDAGSSPVLLNEFAWNILIHPRLKDRDLDLAIRAARVANEKTEGKDASVLDTYARAFFEAGRIAEAIETQKKAIAVALDDAEREQLTKSLQTYESRLK